ncbi:trace amine-associated receptor 1-like [Myripristis murdjan]|uniref:trace amine-associated receptor 1-like n=1 Tax=Myripristis murdjan TaxID=586833 RepID=UPI001175E9D7|nr:trace amine-associated receptor 1-like [Myripristis murdjan]
MTNTGKDIHLCYESDNVSCKMAIIPSTIRVLLYVFLGSISVLTLCGNLLVIIAIIYFKQLHTPTNYLILSLAMSDLLVGALVLPLVIVFSVSSCWYLGDFICKIRHSFDVSLTTSSILNLCFISIDRYVAVCHPLRYKSKINARASAIMILLSWGVSALVGIGITAVGRNEEKCEQLCFSFHIPVSGIIGCVLSFYLPAVIMLSTYFKIFLVAQKQAHSIQNSNCQSVKSGASVSKMERKATKTLAIVMGAFLICWTPFFTGVTINPLINYSIPITAIETFALLGSSNSVLNPFIYAFFYSWFRVAFRMIISGKIFQGNFANSKLL